MDCNMSYLLLFSTKLVTEDTLRNFEPQQKEYIDSTFSLGHSDEYRDENSLSDVVAFHSRETLFFQTDFRCLSQENTGKRTFLFREHILRLQFSHLS